MEMKLASNKIQTRFSPSLLVTVFLSPIFSLSPLLPPHLLPIQCSAWKSHRRIKPHFLPQRLRPDVQRSHMFRLTTHRRKRLSMANVRIRAHTRLICCVRFSVYGQIASGAAGGSGHRTGRFQEFEKNQTRWRIVSYPAVMRQDLK